MYLLTFVFGGFHKLSLALQNNSKSQNLYFDKEKIEDLFDSLCIASHIGKNIGANMRDAFLDVVDIHPIQPSGIVQMAYPRTNFCGVEFRIPLKWNSRERYRGGNYFIESNPIAGLRQLIADDEQQKACSFSNLIYEVSNVMKLIGQAKLFHNIKS
jgi:hypothetical protein